MGLIGDGIKTCIDCGRPFDPRSKLYARRNSKRFCIVDANVRDFAREQFTNELGETPNHEFVRAKMAGETLNAIGLPATESEYCRSCGRFTGAENKSWNLGDGKFREGETPGDCWGAAKNSALFYSNRARSHGRLDIIEAYNTLLSVLNKPG